MTKRHATPHDAEVQSLSTPERSGDVQPKRGSASSASSATDSPPKQDYVPLQPHMWTATGMKPGSSLFGPTLWVREGEAQREIDRQKAIAERALNSLRSFDPKLADHIEGLHK